MQAVARLRLLLAPLEHPSPLRPPAALAVGTTVSFAASAAPMERSFIMIKPDGVHRGVC